MSGSVAGRQVRRLLPREMLMVGMKWVAMDRKMGGMLDGIGDGSTGWGSEPGEQHAWLL